MKYSLPIRLRQPYEQWSIEYEYPKQRDKVTVWEEKLRKYESEEYVHEDDFVPGLEGFLHNIKRWDSSLTFIWYSNNTITLSSILENKCPARTLEKGPFDPATFFPEDPFDVHPFAGRGVCRSIVKRAP